MLTTDSTAGDPVTPLRAPRGRLTLMFVGVVAIGLIVAQAVREPTDGGSGGNLAGPAPEIVLTGFDGTEWRLSDHLRADGRPVVLNLWASWCLPCRDEIPELSAFSDAQSTHFVVGVAVDDQVDAARALASELAPTYLVGMDSTGRLRDRYPSIGMPFTVLIDPQGVIVWSKVGGVTAAELTALAEA